MSRFEPPSTARDPFTDPRTPFDDPGSVASSRTHLPPAGQAPPRNAPYGYSPVNNPSRVPAWMQPTDEKRTSTTSRVLKKTWIIGGLVLVLAAVCIAVPLALHFTKTSSSSAAADHAGNSTTPSTSASNGTVNTNVTTIPNFFAVIDPETPKTAYNSSSVTDSSTEWVLVFSDEFNTDNRSFYPGDDPYWEAMDLHYWQTGDLEWYDPSQVTTANGSLVITLEKAADPTLNHGMSFKSGLISSWNKMCFTGGRVEASVMLPGAHNVHGYWPAVWAMGNLGRAGFGASVDGLWPYSYDACDIGTLQNQTTPDKKGPAAALAPNGDAYNGGALSYASGQRLSRCTCKGESHPGPTHADGSFVGRSAPEIDIFEASSAGGFGTVSQSGQFAPFNAAYTPISMDTNTVIPNKTNTQLNNYKGGAFQQSISAVSNTDQICYEQDAKCYSTYGFEYKPGFDGSYITWMASGVVTWTLKGDALGPDPTSQISARPVPFEPMYVIANLGLSPSFGGTDPATLTFPAHMRIDYIRVYQPKDAVNVGCDPTGAPTQAYINQYMEAYTNPNLTTWVDDFKQTIPKNNLTTTC